MEFIGINYRMTPSSQKVNWIPYPSRSGIRMRSYIVFIPDILTITVRTLMNGRVVFVLFSPVFPRISFTGVNLSLISMPNRLRIICILQVCFPSPVQSIF